MYKHTAIICRRRDDQDLVLESRTYEIPPLPIPFDEEKWGVIVHWEAPSPGIFALETRKYDSLFLVDVEHNGGVVSDEAFQYAKATADGYAYFQAGGGKEIIEYELMRKRLMLPFPTQPEQELRELVSIAHYGAEEYPGYFGPWVPSLLTPFGRMTRYREVDRGIWFVEAGTRWYLSLCYAQYEELTPQAQKNAVGSNGAPNGHLMENVFWPLAHCAPAVYDLLTGHRDKLLPFLTSEAALRRCLLKHFQEFAALRSIEEPEDGPVQFLKLPR